MADRAYSMMTTIQAILYLISVLFMYHTECNKGNTGRPQGYKTFFMLILTVYETSTAHKN